MLTKFRTLNKGKASPKDIEKQFEDVRVKYLRDIEKIRKKYVAQLIELSSNYEIACATEK